MKRKIGLCWEKTGLRFWTFSHHPSRHLPGGMDVWIIVRLSTHFYIRHPGCNPWDHSPESYTVQKRKRHRQYFWLSESFFAFRGDFTPSQVELEGTDPRFRILLIIFIVQITVSKMVSVFDRCKITTFFSYNPLIYKTLFSVVSLYFPRRWWAWPPFCMDNPSSKARRRQNVLS